MSQAQAGSVQPVFHGYCDESYVTDSRYRGIACVSIEEAHAKGAAESLRASTLAEGIPELKWSRTGDGRCGRAAERFIEETFRRIESGLRVDVLVWDTEDARHRVELRDDDRNYERMFYHLLQSALRKRPRGSEWRLFCDQKLGVGWDTLRDCVSAAGRSAGAQSTFGGFLSREQYTLRALSEARSHEEPLVQLADLFAGLAVFSRARYADFAKWARLSIQPALFESDQEASRSDLVRFRLLQGFRQRSLDRKLGVSLESRGGLWTARPDGPFSFWWYEPQSPHDRAPTRGRARRSG